MPKERERVPMATVARPKSNTWRIGAAQLESVIVSELGTKSRAQRTRASCTVRAVRTHMVLLR